MKKLLTVLAIFALIAISFTSCNPAPVEATPEEQEIVTNLLAASMEYWGMNANIDPSQIFDESFDIPVNIEGPVTTSIPGVTLNSGSVKMSLKVKEASSFSASVVVDINGDYGDGNYDLYVSSSGTVTFDAGGNPEYSNQSMSIKLNGKAITIPIDIPV